MRIPLTKYGWPQVVVFPVGVIVLMIFLSFSAAILPLWAVILIELILASVLILSLAFFRDPLRYFPQNSNLLLAPADGKVTQIEEVENESFIGGKTLKIGIFLSIFNVHINRAPCNVKVEKVTYKKGRYINALNPLSGKLNESNDLYLIRADSPKDRLILRQISGAIARRIVCQTIQGEMLSIGQQFGMIKFGSRTELYLPLRNDKYKAECLVKIGDKVKAGVSPLIRYQNARTTE